TPSSAAARRYRGSRRCCTIRGDGTVPKLLCDAQFLQCGRKLVIRAITGALPHDVFGRTPAWPMSASGPKRTSLVAPHMSVFGGPYLEKLADREGRQLVVGSTLDFVHLLQRYF